MRGLILLVVGLIILSPVRAQSGAAPNQGIGAAFLEACYKDDLAKVTQLLDQGAPLEIRDGYGRTPLFLACHGGAGSEDIVKLLLAHGAKADVFSTNGDSTIGRASEYGDLAIAQMVLAAGADPAKANTYGHTPLMLAAREGHDDLVAFLISQHVDVNFESKGESAVQQAIWKDHPTIVQKLFDAGAKLPAEASPDGWNIMSWAAKVNDTAMMDLILANHGNADAPGKDGITPLHTAIRFGTVETVTYLLNKGANPDRADDFGNSPLMFAMLTKKPDIMQVLLDHHANIESKDSLGRTPLNRACQRIQDQEIIFLVEHGADVNTTDLKGETPVRYVNNRGDTAMAKLLQEKGASSQPPFIIEGEKPPVPLTPVQNWALAVGAIYKQSNGEDQYILGGKITPQSSVEELKVDWNVTDKKTLLAELDDLRDSGHHAKYQEEGSKLAELSNGDFDAKIAALKPEDAHQATALRNSYLKWKDRSALAWDMCRSVAMINNGFNAGYIDEQESWNRLFAIAELAQKSFSSWQELNDNFLDGREIWANERNPRFDACSQLLLNPKDSNSPWNQNPWNTQLSPSAGN